MNKIFIQCASYRDPQLVLTIKDMLANAKKPILMAKAFKDAVISGRNSYLSGRMKKNYFASPSSPTRGLI